jgi:hypothetical protein
MHKVLLQFVAIGILAVTTSVANAEQPGAFELPDWAKTIVAKAASFELYSLDPGQDVDPKDKARLHGWKVLGKTTLKRTDEAGKALLQALDKSRVGLGAKCFDPRHAIHAEHDGKKVDVLICFECGWAYVYPSDGDHVILKIDRTAEKVFNKLLTDAKVPLPKQAN